MSKRKNIILCGFMGTGKSVVGRLAARRLRYGFIDSDVLIESRYGMSVSKIFAVHGEEFFRVQENQIVREMLSVSGTVIAAGGGMIIPGENFEMLSRSGKLILLTASVETICKRLEGEEKRPLLEGGDTVSLAEKLLSDRDDIYGRIKCKVNTDFLSINQVCNEVIKLSEEIQ